MFKKAFAKMREKIANLPQDLDQVVQVLPEFARHKLGELNQETTTAIVAVLKRIADDDDSRHALVDFIHRSCILLSSKEMGVVAVALDELSTTTEDKLGPLFPEWGSNDKEMAELRGQLSGLLDKEKELDAQIDNLREKVKAAEAGLPAITHIDDIPQHLLEEVVQKTIKSMLDGVDTATKMAAHTPPSEQLLFPNL